MPELMVDSRVSRGRCHDNAAAKLAKRSFTALGVYIPTDTKTCLSGLLTSAFRNIHICTGTLEVCF